MNFHTCSCDPFCSAGKPDKMLFITISLTEKILLTKCVLSIFFFGKMDLIIGQRFNWNLICTLVHQLYDFNL